MKSYTFTMKAAVSFDAGHEVIMGIAGHVSRAMLSRYSRADRNETVRRRRDRCSASRG
jgi:hypothetical protein